MDEIDEAIHRLHRTADRVEQLIDRDFSEMDDGSKKAGNHFCMRAIRYSCGSPACLIGWHLELHGVNLEADILTVFENFHGLSPLQKYRFDLGFDLSPVNDLVEPVRKQADHAAGSCHSGHITAQRAAKVLRNFADTGIVNWEIENE